MTPEAKVKAEIVAYLKSVGAWYDNNVRTGYGRAGVPDLVCCYRGRFLAIEVKASGAKAPTPYQRRELAAIVQAGGRAIVAWEVFHVMEEIKAIDGECTTDDLLDAFNKSRGNVVEELPDGSYRRKPIPF